MNKTKDKTLGTPNKQLKPYAKALNPEMGVNLLESRMHIISIFHEATLARYKRPFYKEMPRSSETSDSKKFSILKKGIGIEGEKTIETS